MPSFYQIIKYERRFQQGECPSLQNCAKICWQLYWQCRCMVASLMMIAQSIWWRCLHSTLSPLSLSLLSILSSSLVLTLSHKCHNISIKQILLSLMDTWCLLSTITWYLTLAQEAGGVKNCLGANNDIPKTHTSTYLLKAPAQVLALHNSVYYRRPLWASLYNNQGVL